MSVIALTPFREQKRESNIQALALALDTALPLDMYIEEGTGFAILTNEAWQSLEHMFDAFCITVSRDIPAERLIDLWTYLTGELGYDLRLFFRNETLYHSIKGRLAPELTQYLDALIRGDTSAARDFAKGLDIPGNCPVATRRPVIAVPIRKTDQ